MNDTNLIISLVSNIFDLLIIIYVLGVIPSRLKRVLKKQDVIIKNQNIIEKKVIDKTK